MVRIGFDGAGEWVEGEITHVTKSYGYLRYCVRRWDTREEMHYVAPEDVKEWIDLDENKAA